MRISLLSGLPMVSIFTSFQFGGIRAAMSKMAVACIPFLVITLSSQPAE